MNFIVRRVVLILTALYLDHSGWAQLTIFLFMSQASTLYLAYSKPFKSQFLNRLEMVNELLIYTLAVFCMVIVGFGMNVDDVKFQGKFLTAILYFKILLNGVIILGSMVYVIRMAIKHYYIKK